uniref:Uncharacterized protein n=1 Tax=Triticum urartu TaxID=4572 RepID=A0A8R7PPK7_TRIUA
MVFWLMNWFVWIVKDWQRLESSSGTLFLVFLCLLTKSYCLVGERPYESIQDNMHKAFPSVLQLESAALKNEC